MTQRDAVLPAPVGPAPGADGQPLSALPTPGVLARKLLQAAEDERDEWADALHDGPLQSLVVARYAADLAVQGGDLVAARDAIQQALVELRRALWTLRPRGAAGLRDAVGELSARVVAAGGAPLVVGGEVDADGTSAALAFRLIQAMAVAGAPAVLIELRQEGSQIVLDLGGGASLAAPERWADQALALGGSLSWSAAGLRLALPLPVPSCLERRTPT